MVQAKYRGYDTDSEVWRYGYYFCMEDITLAALYNSEEQWQKDKKANEHHLILWNGFSDWCMPKPHYQSEVDGDSVGQSTRKFDKNGKEIFSGDIVKCYADTDEMGNDLYFYYKVIFHDTYSCWWLSDINTQEDEYLHEFNSNDIEVIGNTYENYILNGEVNNKNSVTE